MNLLTKDFSKIKVQYNVCKRKFEWFNTCASSMKYIKIHNKNEHIWCTFHEKKIDFIKRIVHILYFE